MHRMFGSRTALVAWATAQQDLILRTGEDLSPELTDLARCVGVKAPERIRICRVEGLSIPFHLQAAGVRSGDVTGLTFGYGVRIVRRCESLRLLSHEFRHVHQHERLGGVPGFISEYLRQLAFHGYRGAPLEAEARRYEKTQ